MAIHGISSMATRQLLADLVLAAGEQAGCTVAVESVGGVHAAKRVQAGEALDFAVLAADAIDKLTGGGSIAAGSRVDLARSGVAACVRAGAAQPDIGSEDALRQAVLAASSVAYSTGPSGVALLALFERWGIVSALQGRMVQASPGVPVGMLVARGDAALGFQQQSELMHLDGIAVLGPLPAAVQITTTFSAGLCTASRQAEQARGVLAFLASPAASAVKRRHGMEPA